MSGDEDHARLASAIPGGKLTCDLEAGLLAQVNVKQDNVRLQLAAGLVRLRSGRRDASHADPLALEQLGGSAEEVRAVVNDEAAHRHGSSLHPSGRFAIAASWKARSQPACMDVGR
jgi:hypothetical protein